MQTKIFTNQLPSGHRRVAQAKQESINDRACENGRQGEQGNSPEPEIEQEGRGGADNKQLGIQAFAAGGTDVTLTADPEVAMLLLADFEGRKSIVHSHDKEARDEVP
jgi:hypothetical protein